MKLRTKAVIALGGFLILVNPTASNAAAHLISNIKDSAISSLKDQVNKTVQSASTSNGTPAVNAPGIETGNPASHSFTFTNGNGTPARWNPCEVHTIWINPANAPAGAVDDFKQAVANMEGATGLRFNVTTSNATPSSNWGQVDSAGKGWAPVLVAWGAPGTSVLGTDGESADTAPVFYPNSNGEKVIVSGQMIFNTQDQGYTPGFGEGMSRGALMMHELGHLVGLAHVDDTGELMDPAIGAVTSYHAGDLAGLAAVGATGGCIADPSAPWGN